MSIGPVLVPVNSISAATASVREQAHERVGIVVVPGIIPWSSSRSASSLDTGHVLNALGYSITFAPSPPLVKPPTA